MSSSSRNGAARGAASRAVARLSFVAFGVLTGLAVIYTPAMTTAPKDWRLFYDTALLLVSGRVSEAYPGITPGYPFLYPPPFIWHVAWLGALSPGAAHVVLVVAMVALLVAALWVLHRALDDRGRSLDSWIFVVLSSSGFIWMIAAGHIAAWFVFLVAVALLLWKHQQELAAGLTLSLLAIKPHYFVPILLCVLLGRAWRVLGGAVGGACLLALTTVPLGPNIWARYFEQLGSVSEVVAGIPPWKQITLLAFWRSVLGDSRPSLVLGATASCAVPCVLVVGLAWIRCRPLDVAVPRLLALTVLMLVSCNVYAFHYDGLLLAVAGAVWYLRGHQYTSARNHLAVGATILLAFLAQHVSAMLIQGGLSLSGPILAAWLIIDGLDLLRAPRTRRPCRPCAAVSPEAVS